MRSLWQNYPNLQIPVCLALSVLAALAVRVVWRKLLPAITARTRTTLDERIARATAAPVAAGALLFGLWRTALLARGTLDLSDAWWQDVSMALEVATIFAVALTANGVMQGILQWYGAEIAPRTNTELDDEFLPLIRRIVFIVVLFIATAMALHELGKDITALVATASVASLAVALAAQDTLANMISGLMIMIDRPFRVGDRIEFRDGKVGDVLEVGMRSTRILSLDNHVLVVPNKDLASERIINHKVLDPKARLVQRFGVAYGSDVSHVKRSVLAVVRETPHVLPVPDPQILLVEFGPSSLDFELRCWIDHYANYWTTKDVINTGILDAFAQQGIQIPFPQTEVRVIGLPAEVVMPGAREAAAGKE